MRAGKDLIIDKMNQLIFTNKARRVKVGKGLIGLRITKGAVQTVEVKSLYNIRAQE